MTKFYEEIKMMAHQDMLSVLQELAMKRRKKDRANICNLLGNMVLEELFRH